MDKILLAAAILPAVILLLYIRSKDRIEKEPWGLLIKLFALGALTTISAIILELLGTSVIDSFLSKGTVEYNLINNFLIIALAEESGKFFALKLRTWNEPEFNFTYDAVVYAVAVSLGFATLENILYVLGEGTMGIAIMRGLLSVPGHAIDSVFMGYYYGLAQRCRYMNNASGARRNLFKALLAPVLIHGFYDFTLSMKSDIFMGIFFLFEIIITIVSIVKVNKLSREDTPLSPFLNNPYFQQNMYQQNPYQQNPYQQNPYQQNPYQQNPYQQNPYQQNPYQQNPYQQNPYQQPPYQQNPYQQNPYQQNPYQQNNNANPYSNGYYNNNRRQ